MLESEAYMTYRAYATGEMTLKPKSTKKKSDSESSPKMKPTQDSKGKRIKTSAKGDKPAKMKQSATKSKGLTVLSEVALPEADQLKLASKRSKKEFHSSHASGSGDGVDIQLKVLDEQQQTVSGINEGAGDKPEVPNVPEYRSESENESWTFSQGEDDEENDEHDSEDDNDEHDSANDNDDEDDDQENVSGETKSDDDEDDFVHLNLSTYNADDQEEEKANDDDEVSYDQKVSTPPDYEIKDEEENQEDDNNVMGGEQEDEEDEKLYGDLNLNLDKRDAEMTNAQTNQETEEVHVTLTTEPLVVQQQSSSVSSDLMSKFINPSLDTGIDSILNPNVQSDIPVNVSVSATTETPSSDTTIPQPPIPIIQPQQQTHDSTTTTTLPEIPNFASLFGFEQRVSSLEIELSELKQTNQFTEDLSSIQGILKSNKLREEAQAENDEFLKQIDSNIKAIIKDQVKAQVSKIMPKVEKYVTESLGAEVLARSSNQPQTSYAAAVSLSEFELKKILINKIEENKSMNRSDIQKNLYNTLIESYNSDKDLFALYGDVVTLKRGRDDQDKDKEPSAVLNQGTKRKKSGKEESSKEATQKESKSISSSKEPLHQEFNTGNDDVSLLDWHNPKGRPYPHDLSKPLPLIQNARGRQVIPFDHFINNDLEYLKGGSLSQKYTTSLTKTKAADYGHVKWIEDKVPRSIWSPAQVVYDKHAYWGTYHWGPKRQRFYGYATNMETSKDVYSRHRIIAVTSLKIMEFFGYKHLEEITVRRQDDQLYRFREGDFKRLRRQDIEDMLLLLVQGKLTNLNLDERFALNVALRMYTRRIVIQERMEDLQLAVESYQKKINLSRPDSYRSDLRKMTPYTAYHDIQGIIYQDDMDRNRLMRTDELYKFSDGTLNHVRTALNDIDTGIQMRYSNPMIQPEPEGSTQGYPLDSVEVLRSILTDLKVTPTNHRRMTKPYSSPRFIANYFNAGYLKMDMEVSGSS
ncbi:hypothetical protein Tco_1449939 [Tanacetum coccineum]